MSFKWLCEAPNFNFGEDTEKQRETKKDWWNKIEGTGMGNDKKMESRQETS